MPIEKLAILGDVQYNIAVFLSSWIYYAGYVC